MRLEMQNFETPGVMGPKWAVLLVQASRGRSTKQSHTGKSDVLGNIQGPQQLRHPSKLVPITIGFLVVRREMTGCTDPAKL